MISYVESLGQELGQSAESTPFHLDRRVRKKTHSKPADFEAAVAYALGRLKNELSPELRYHNLRHTQEDVLAGVIRLADLLELPDEQKHLVQVSAAFHDLGFIHQYSGHEQVSADMAASFLPGFGLTVQQVQAVIGMIMATHLPQDPHNLLEQIVADADMDVLGRVDFWIRNQGLRNELAAYGFPRNEFDWYRQQLQFLKAHVYFTSAAEQLRGPGKRQNIINMEVHLLHIGENGNRESIRR